MKKNEQPSLLEESTTKQKDMVARKNPHPHASGRRFPRRVFFPSKMRANIKEPEAFLFRTWKRIFPRSSNEDASEPFSWIPEPPSQVQDPLETLRQSLEKDSHHLTSRLLKQRRERFQRFVQKKIHRPWKWVLRQCAMHMGLLISSILLFCFFLVSAVQPNIFRAFLPVQTIIYDFFSSFSGAVLQDVEVQGATHAKKADILRMMQVQLGDPMLSLDLTALQKRLRKGGLFSNIEIIRMFPQKLLIRLSENTPIALFQNPKTQTLEVVGVSGNTIAADAKNFSFLPLISGENAMNSIGDLERIEQILSPLSLHIKAFVRIYGRRWNLVLDNGMEIWLPQNHVEETLKALIQQDKIQQFFRFNNIQVMDLRLPDRVRFLLK